MVSNILIVDEDRHYRGIHRRKLNKLRALLQFVENSKDAIRTISRNHYDVVIIKDSNIKDCNGPKFYDELREAGYEGPVLVLTANPKPHREKYNGILDLVHKSISGKKLCSLISTYFEDNLPANGTSYIKQECS